MTDDESFAASVRLQWMVWRDLVVELAHFLDVPGLHHVIDQVRPSQVDETGARGPWAPLPEDLDDQRQALLYDLVRVAEAKMGGRWPFPKDLPPQVPDDLSGLTDSPS